MTNTLKSNNYKHVSFNKEAGLHTLYSLDSKTFERYTASKGFAGFTLKYKNTELEFCNSYSETETAQLLRYMLKVQRWGEQHPLAHSTMMNVYRNYIAN